MLWLITYLEAAEPVPPWQAKFKMIEKLSTNAVQLACDKFGSHIVEACYERANIELKKKLVSVLAEKHK